MSLGLEELCGILQAVVIPVLDGLHGPSGNSGWLDFL